MEGMMPDIRKWTSKKLDREIAFAKAALTPGHPETFAWLRELSAELTRRTLGNA
jgi:hypothetical protein